MPTYEMVGTESVLLNLLRRWQDNAIDASLTAWGMKLAEVTGQTPSSELVGPVDRDPRC